MKTPWGYSDYSEDYGNGIKFYGTPSHGGYKIPKKLNNLIPNYMRNEDGWYEEDCDWSIPVVTIGTYFNREEFVKNYKVALDTFKNWHWQAYEKYFDVELQEGKSYMKDQYLFIEKHKNDLIVVSATSSDEIPGMVDCHVVRGGRDHSGNYASSERYKYLVERDEYRAGTGKFGFIIDPNKHQLVKEGW